MWGLDDLQYCNFLVWEWKISSVHCQHFILLRKRGLWGNGWQCSGGSDNRCDEWIKQPIRFQKRGSNWIVEENVESIGKYMWGLDNP